MRIRREYPIFAHARKLRELASDLNMTVPTMSAAYDDAGLSAPIRWSALSPLAVEVLMESVEKHGYGPADFCSRRGYPKAGLFRLLASAYPDRWKKLQSVRKERSSGYARGRSLEYRTRDSLRKRGWFAQRMPASKGGFDILAIPSFMSSDRPRIHFISCRRSGTVSSAEQHALLDLATKHGAIALIVSNPHRGEIRYEQITRVGKTIARGKWSERT